MSCPTEADLDAMLADELKPAIADAIRDHLDDCESCSAEVLTRVRKRAAPPEPTTIGRFVIRGVLGSGSMGTVFLAEDPALERETAVKVLRAGRTSADRAERLLREARAIAQVHHANVVAVYEVGRDGDLAYFAMERVRGTTLRAAIASRPSVATVQRWLVQLARGLRAIHDAGLVHRDLKPDNVFVETATSRVVIGDLGLAESAATDDTSSSSGGAGSPAYMAPEQRRASGTVDTRSDIYAFGVTAWEAFTGHRPGDGSSLAGVPRAIARMIERCLALEPSRRPELAQIIDLLEPRRTRWWSIAGASVLAAAAVFAVVALAKPASSASRMRISRLFDVPLRSPLGVSPDAQYIATAPTNTIEVRGLKSAEVFTIPIPSLSEVRTIELDGDTVRYAPRGVGVMRWSFRTGASVLEEIPEPLASTWCGRSTRGHVFYENRRLWIQHDGVRVAEWEIADGSPFVMSPDRTRLMYLTTSVHGTGRVVIRDLIHGGEVRSDEIVEPTAAAWIDDQTIVYATQTITQPTLYRVALAGNGLGTPEKWFASDAGWFSRIAIGDGSVFGIVMHPRAESRLVEDGQIRDFSNVGVALAWLSDDQLVAWIRSTQRIEVRGREEWSWNRISSLQIPMPHEPANATLSDRTLILAVRRPGGRDAIAYSLDTGAQLWRHDAIHAVRCSGDRHPPCFAMRSKGEGFEVVAIDPSTGELGPRALYSGELWDFAVRDDGERLLVGGPQLDELDGTGGFVRTIPLDLGMGLIRSVAYEPHGSSALVTGTARRNNYIVGRVQLDSEPFRFAPIVTSDRDILALARPAPSSGRLSFVARVYSPEVSKLEATP